MLMLKERAQSAPSRPVNSFIRSFFTFNVRNDESKSIKRQQISGQEGLFYTRAFIELLIPNFY